MRASLPLRAPAKLNLTLEVLSKDDDGLHGIRSVMVPIDLCDELYVDASSAFRFRCEPPELAADNLVVRALETLGLANAPFDLYLHKRIPTGAGLGGGSSDAAAILLAAQRGLFPLRGEVDYLNAARSLGSDVPFFLVQTAALVEGTGERVTALAATPAWHAIIIKPDIAVQTAHAYALIDRFAREVRPRNASLSLQLAQALQRSEFAAVRALLHNDFQDVLAGQVPQIAKALSILRDAGAERPTLTGSGSCVFALSETAEECDAVARNVRLPAGYELFRCTFLSSTVWQTAP